MTDLPTLSVALWKRQPTRLGCMVAAVHKLLELLQQRGVLDHRETDDYDLHLEGRVKQFQAANGLTADGVVGPKTWQALQAPVPKERAIEILKSSLVPFDPRLLAARLKVVEIALAEEAKDVREVPPGSNRSPEIDKYVPAARRGDAWCAWFVTWIYAAAREEGPLARLTGGSTGSYMLQAAVEGTWVNAQKTLVEPYPGDVFILSGYDATGRKRISGHTGVVLQRQLVEGNWRFLTVEGNAGNRVCFRMRSTAEKSLHGFIRANALPGEYIPPIDLSFAAALTNTAKDTWD